MQDSDSLWQAAPPARQALRRMLSRQNATLTLAWTVVRDAPLANAHAGPTCAGSQAVPLADNTRRQMVEMLKASLKVPTSSRSMRNVQMEFMKTFCFE